jgi:phosphatidylglycerol:prolipoprotein diacylglycerol transferase
MEWIEGISKIVFPGLGLTLNPPAGLAIGSLTFNFYGLIIAVGLMLAVIYAWKRSLQFGIKPDDITDGVLCVAPVAIIFARLYYCIFNWKAGGYAANPISVLYIWEGGIAIYGSVIGAVLATVVYCWYKEIKLTAVLDLVALGFLIGQFVGRWGNFFNREAFGYETESFLRMGLYLTEEGAVSNTMFYYHPTFLYESLWNMTGFVLLHFLSKRRQYDGQIALGYVVWYGLGRTFIEGLRTDSLYWGQIRVSQALAAGSVIIAATVMVILAWRSHDPAKLYVNRIPEEEPEEAEEEPEESAE